MKTSRIFLFLLTSSTLFAPTLFALDVPNAQIERGRQWFLHSSKALACATCHSLEGHGNAIGPDLTRLATVVGPRGLVMTIQMTMTAYVQHVELQNGRTFPGIQKQKQNDVLEIYDLSKPPPFCSISNPAT
jgi:cytochrome c peroxidase